MNGEKRQGLNLFMRAFWCWLRALGVCCFLGFPGWSATWVQDGGSLNDVPTDSAYSGPSIDGDVNGVPYVGWAEGSSNGIVKKNNGGVWQKVGATIASGACYNPGLALGGTVPYFGYNYISGSPAVYQAWMTYYNGAS